MPQAISRNITITPAVPSRLGWWDERAIGYIVPQPIELIIHAALNMPAEIWLETPGALDRVAEAYIAACRKAGYFLHHSSHQKCLFTQPALSGYRARLKDYRACQAFYLRRSAQGGH